ncbi:hypothetical protein K9M74_03055 [Candidatus Woesearchaeota archaeon]|nr:hypothetical protein [Candidatus Woesearchaeota archaeon]
MTLQKTIVDMNKLSQYKPNKSVLAVGLPREVSLWLNQGITFVGFKECYVAPSASNAMDFLEKNAHRLESPVSHLIAAPSYRYEDDKMPLAELPFCDYEGLDYFQNRKRAPTEFMQGLQLARQVKEQFPDITLAMYGSGYDGSMTQAKELDVDYVPTSFQWNIPFTIMEYLRNENNELFSK